MNDAGNLDEAVHLNYTEKNVFIFVVYAFDSVVFAFSRSLRNENEKKMEIR